jgi:outer membrane protein assembly factor BamD
MHCLRRPVRPAHLLLSAAVLMLSACAGTPDEVPYVERPVEQIYNEASNALDSERHLLAAALFDEVERQHPYSQWAVRAKLMGAYAHYQAKRYDDAVDTIDRFIALHPGNRDVAYAFYLKGISYYEQISDVRRDQSSTEEALKALQEVVRRFPTSPYARDAKLKIDLVRDHLAGKEMEVGRYYQITGNQMAAVKRFRRVVDEYQTTSHVPEALHRLTESYLVLGITEEAQVAAAVLGHNYPGSEWYQDSYDLMQNKATVTEDGFLSRAFDWVF